MNEEQVRDYADDKFEWPQVKDLRPAQAGRLLDDIERQSSEANKRADTLKKRKAQAKQIVLAVADEYELRSVDFTAESGRRVAYTPKIVDHFDVDNPEAFKAWANEQGGENYYDPTPKLREGIFRDEMRRRVQDGAALPPGVRRYTAVDLGRTSKVG